MIQIKLKVTNAFTITYVNTPPNLQITFRNLNFTQQKKNAPQTVAHERHALKVAHRFDRQRGELPKIVPPSR